MVQTKGRTLGGLIFAFIFPSSFFILLVFFLTLFQGVGNAVNDLAQRLMSADAMKAPLAVFADAEALHMICTEKNKVRSMCWVLLDTPIDTAAVHNAVGGFVLTVLIATAPSLL